MQDGGSNPLTSTEKKQNMKVPKITSLFFWNRPKKRELTPGEKIAELMKAAIEYAPQVKKLLRDIKYGDDTLGSEPSYESQKIAKLYDFFNNPGNMAVDNNGVFFTQPTIPMELAFMQDGETPIVNEPPKFTKAQANPKDVLVELETIPTPFTLLHLDEKIETLKDKSIMLNQRYAKEQIDGLVERLENRKNYEPYVDFFTRFKNTTDEHIDALLDKYLLVIKDAQLFIPTFPKEAIDVMKEYTAVCKKVCSKEPVYYVIAEEKDFQKKYEKLDPILLVQSPFGFYWQILGAWDKEMLLLTEL